ncbi:MAG: TonB-dependent receptor plug domain-containing protein [Saprospiraceae bacterium]|nr:TonB-dependent receptor plug domain-containing protein [Saprospiraceae bacterium]
MKSTFLTIILCCSYFLSMSQDTILPLQEVVIIGNWAEKNTPISYLNISKKEIERFNFGQDIPYILSNTPSLVESSDAGTGIGYTNIKIRGIDQTRINITLNGVTMNDPESHQVFWVNLPDLSSSTEQIQIQRGVGISTNGTGAFGASINLNTSKINMKPYSNINVGIGSFNTKIANISFGTGLIDHKFGVDGRISKIVSDGYIDRAKVNLSSYYLSSYYLWKKSSLRLNIINGKEITYQAWNGVPINYQNDPILRRYNSSGTEKSGEPYQNEIDNYGQTHLQLIHKQEFNNNMYQNITLHYTKGGGYFEQYKANQQLNDYGLKHVILNSDTIRSTDLIRDRWLDNDYYGIVYDIHYQLNKSNFTIGAAANEYYGKHFGKIIWAQFASNSNNFDNYYNWRGKKMT